MVSASRFAFSFSLRGATLHHTPRRIAMFLCLGRFGFPAFLLLTPFTFWLPEFPASTHFVYFSLIGRLLLSAGGLRFEAQWHASRSIVLLLHFRLLTFALDVLAFAFWASCFWFL
jgi:hypothetical protein